MTRLYIDIETRSRVDLRKSSPYRYVEDERFGILMAAWALDDDPIQVAFTEDEIREIPALWEVDETIVRVAHNAAFERICFSAFLGWPVGEYLPPEDWHDTMAVAAEKGYPHSLDELARAMGGEQKSKAGTALINFFCKPNRQGEFNRPEDHPEKWKQFVDYCIQDVVTLRDVDKRLGDFPTETERQVYYADQRVNDRGLRIDREMATYAMEAADDNRMGQELEISSLTGVVNPGSGPQMLEWLRGDGKLPIPNMRAETIEKALARKNIDPTTRRVLELRQELALVASKKFSAALEAANSDDRLRGGFRFFGAHTGRWAGSGVQPHNLPRAQLESETMTEAAILDLKLGLGADAFTLKALVRALFLGPYTVVDYAAIEARVIAWLAGEEWALEAFRNRRDIYVETAERMGGLTRSQGKVAVLALGFGGGRESLRAMGGEGSDNVLQRMVNQWRAANPTIVAFWKEMQNAFHDGGPAGAGHIYVETDGDSRLVRLPSGRAITYHGCEWKWEETQFGPRLAASFLDPKRPGFRARTYGGRLSENATQATARDVLAEALVRLQERGFVPVGHVHDEILVEGHNSVADVTSVMTEPPAWAAGLPIDGAGFTCARYRKD